MTRRRRLRRLWWPAIAAAFIAAALVLLRMAAAAAPANAASSVSSTPVETLTGGALLLFAGAGLTVVLWLRGRGGGARRRTPVHARAAAPGGDPPGGSPMPGTNGAPTGPGPDGPDPGEGERSSWAASAEAPDWAYPDHPDWPAGCTGQPLTPDHPSWPDGGLRQPLTPDHPSWPDGGLRQPIGYGRPHGTDADFLYADHAPVVRPARGRHVRVPAGYSGYPRPGVPTGDTPQRWSAQLARNPGPVLVADRALADADQQAAAIRQEAAAIKDQAAAQAAAIREAADREIAELRATVLAMSDELRRVAEYVTQSLTSLGQPAVPPPARAGPHPLATPVQPDAAPSAQPAGKPGTSAKGRQARAMHKMVAAFVAVSVIGVVAGAAEIALHGFPFFVFRANGAGASLTGLREDQGPGQPDAPAARRKAPAATPGATAKAHHPGAISKDKKSHGGQSQGKQAHGKQRQSKQAHGRQPQGKQAHGKQRQSKQPAGRESPKPG